jgi:biopolymer transport protein ExbB
MRLSVTLASILVLAGARAAGAQQAGAPAAESAFARAALDVQRDLEASTAELDRLRERIAAEKVPLGRRLSELEAELSRARQEYQQASRTLDAQTLEVSNLRSEIGKLREQSAYLSNLLAEYARNFESRLHVAELQRYRAVIEAAKLAAENTSLAERDVFRAQAELVGASLERLRDACGGARFAGTAVSSDGVVHRGTFVLVGPAAVFCSDDGAVTGTAEQRLGSLEPSVVAFGSAADADAAARIVSQGQGSFPLDPTLGNAHKVAAVDEGIWRHVQKGGPVMIPIFALAAAALLVGLYKWAALTSIRMPSREQIAALLHAVSTRDRERCRRAVEPMRGPVGRMLAAGVEHLEEPRELVEEIMYESVLKTRLELQRWLPFVAITASSAPLLGLLGTVTGIMNTFTLMTVFGTGDIRTLSSGISEALITTEYGLYVAIPSLLLYAFLSRKARSVIDRMEKAAVALLNQIGKTPFRPPASAVRHEERHAPARPEARATRAPEPQPAIE